MTDDLKTDAPQPVMPSADRLREVPESAPTPPTMQPGPESAPTPESFRPASPQSTPAPAAPAVEPAAVASPEELPKLPGGRSLGKPMVKPEDRVPFGRQTLRMKAAEIPGYVQRWFNDVPGRIEAARNAGYVHVEQDGVPVKLVVGATDKGDGINGYLMAIPKDLYDETFANKQAMDDQVDLTLRRGQINASPDDNRYVPEGMIKIDASNRPR